MLYYLTDALLVKSTSPQYNDVISAVENLAISVFERKHELYGDFNVLDAMSKNTDLGLRSRSILNRIVQNYPSRSIPKEITYYVEVVPKVFIRKRLVNHRIVVQLPVSELQDSRSVQASCLIGEFYYDCKFFRQILLRYMKHKDLTTPICFDDIAGCGSTLIDHVKQYLKGDKRPTLAIVDTDKKYPSQPIQANTTCGKCIRKYVDNVLYKFIHMNVHEAENLVPMEVIDNLNWIGAGVGFKKSFDTLRNHPESEDILAFFDIKKGIKNCPELKASKEYQDFCELCCSFDPSNPANTNFYQYFSNLADDAVIFPMLSKKLLKDAINYMKTHSNDDFQLLGYQKREWIKISKMMLNWGICRNNEAVN